MLTRIEASFSDAVTVEVEPATGAESTLSTRAGHVSVRLAPGAALAVTLPDGTSALAPVDGSPHRFEAAIGLTILGPEAIQAAAHSAAAPTALRAEDADSTLLFSDVRAALGGSTDDTLVGLDVLSAALDRGPAPPSAVRGGRDGDAAHDDATVTAGRQRGRRAAAAGETPAALRLEPPTLSHSMLGAVPPTHGTPGTRASDPAAGLATGSSPAPSSADEADEAEDADATTVAPRSLLGAAAMPGALAAPAPGEGHSVPLAIAPGFTPSAPAPGGASPAARGAAPTDSPQEDPDLTTVRARLSPATPATPATPAQPAAPAQAQAAPAEDPDVTTLAPRASLLAGAATSSAPAGHPPLPSERPGSAPSGTEDPDLTTLATRRGRTAQGVPAHRVAAPPAPAPTPAAHGTALLVQDAHGTREVPLAGTVVVGRTPSPAQVRERDARGLTVVPTGPGVSHSHAAIRRQGAVVLVRDLWSTNGTRVRSAGVPPFRLRDGEEVPVSDGTVVELGDGVVITIVERGEG